MQASIGAVLHDSGAEAPHLQPYAGMGTLDDAIREHLDLKRRLGAPEDELEQKEAEAFGPAGARRPAAEPATGESPEPEPEPELAAEVPPDPEEPAPAAEHLEPAPEPAGRWAAEDVLDRDEVLPEDSLEPNGSYSVPDPVPTPREEESPPREQPVEAWEEDDEEPPEDVLEETPDFLEETPEHDRLWFEQKPPKDFDFE
jgi:hypothetical protein